MNELLTIGMPVYNEEKNIAQALESLLAQTYKNFVLVISDNASTDNTGEICRRYAEKDKRIIYVRQNKNIGSTLNFSYLAKRAETPFFIWCSGNDKWHPSFVEKLLPAFEEKDIILSYSEGVAINPDGTLSGDGEYDNTTTGIDNPAKRFLYFFRRFRVKSTTNLFYGIWRTQALKKCSLDTKAIYPDMLILYEATIEGKFKMHKEVLFWMKRNPVDYKEWLRKLHSYETGEEFTGKENIFLFTTSFILEVAMVPFHKHYPLKIATRIWLSVNVIIMFMLIFPVQARLNGISKKILPSNYYLKIKAFYKKITCQQ